MPRDHQTKTMQVGLRCVILSFYKLFLEEHIPELGRRKSEVVKEALENVTHLIELSDGINTRAAGRRNRGAINREELGLFYFSPWTNRYLS